MLDSEEAGEIVLRQGSDLVWQEDKGQQTQNF